MNKVVLITGAARRVGAAIADAFHRANYDVIVHYRHSKNDAEALTASFNRQRPHSAACIYADLDNASHYEKLIFDSENIFGRLDVLINNASAFFKTPVSTITEQDWDLLFNSNLKAPLFLSQAAAPLLKQSQGNIINIIDIQKPKKNYTVYACAKAGLLMLTKSLALELAPEIRVNAIAPGHVIWPENTEAFSEIEKTTILADTLLKKNVDPLAIAETALFLANQPSITAEVICVDAGRL
ncbi:MAG: pteridine reductase [Coxiellaceae bacterium]|nr:pteridine reductase [Coxiellaceae bacterium]